MYYSLLPNLLATAFVSSSDFCRLCIQCAVRFKNGNNRHLYTMANANGWGKKQVDAKNVSLRRRRKKRYKKKLTSWAAERQNADSYFFLFIFFSVLLMVGCYSLCSVTKHSFNTYKEHWLRLQLWLPLCWSWFLLFQLRISYKLKFKYNQQAQRNAHEKKNQTKQSVRMKTNKMAMKTSKSWGRIPQNSWLLNWRWMKPNINTANHSRTRYSDQNEKKIRNRRTMWTRIIEAKMIETPTMKMTQERYNVRAK